MDKWDRRFLKLAALASTWSRDPSTKTGASVTDSQKRVVSIGFNGFPQGILDDERLLERKLKYEIILHAEANSILFAQRPLIGCTLYVYPFPPCSRCASLIIQSGIRRVVAPKLTEELEGRWKESLDLARRLFSEAGVELIEALPIEIYEGET